MKRKPGLQASLGLFDAVAVSVGAIIGGGIFVVTGVGAGVAGSAVVVSMVVALEVKGVGPETASRILGKMHSKEDEFYMHLLKAKIQFLKTRQYWENRRTYDS